MKFLKYLLPGLFGLLALTACDRDPITEEIPQSLPVPTLTYKYDCDRYRELNFWVTLSGEKNPKWVPTFYIENASLYDITSGDYITVDDIYFYERDYNNEELKDNETRRLVVRTSYGYYEPKMEAGHTYRLSFDLHTVFYMDYDHEWDIYDKYGVQLKTSVPGTPDPLIQTITFTYTGSDY